MIEAPEASVDVLAQTCPTARVETRLPLALVEEIDKARGPVSRAEYLTMLVDAAMTREHPHLPDGAGEQRAWIDTLARRKYARHVRSVELARDRGRS